MSKTTPPVPLICYGESGWDIVSGSQFPGGAAITLAYHLHKFGFPAVPVTRVGIDDAGKNLIRFVEQHSISAEYFQLDYELMTGKTFTAPYLGTMRQELPREAAWDKIAWDPAFAQLLTEDACLIFGSVAARDPVSRNTLFQMIEAVPLRIVQLGLKSAYYTKKTIEHCLQGGYLVQLLPDELELVTGWFSNYATVEERMQVLQDRFQLPFVVVTEGCSGAVLRAGSSFYYHKGFAGPITEQTGCPEAFLAGLLSRLFLQHKPEDAMQYGCAAGQLMAELPGACPDYRLEAIGRLITKNGTIS